MKHHIVTSSVLSAILLAAMLSVANAQQPSAAGQERGAAQSNNRRWMEMDKNGDGKLTVDESTGLMKTLFNRVDENKDGFLDKVELDALAARLAQGRNPGTQQPRNNNRNQRPMMSAEAWAKQAPKGVTEEEAMKWKTTGFQQANSMGGGEQAIQKSGKLRVFVLMGQSNMHGLARADELKSPYNKKHDRIRIWANGRWEYFVPRNRFGPGVAMAHQLAELWPEDTIGIIKVSAGGTGVRAFEKNWSFERANRTFDGRKGSLYKDLMNAVTEADNISKPVYSGFVWKQGGADGTRKDLADEYYDTFEQLVSDLRKDLSAPDIPVFVLTYASDEDLAAHTFTGNRRYFKTVLMAHNKADRDIPTPPRFITESCPSRKTVCTSTMRARSNSGR